MRIHNLYVDAQGETHFRDIEVKWTKEGPGGKMSDTLKATGIIFRQTPGSYDYAWHPAPRRQYIINLDGGVDVGVIQHQQRAMAAQFKRQRLEARRCPCGDLLGNAARADDQCLATEFSANLGHRLRRGCRAEQSHAHGTAPAIISTPRSGCVRAAMADLETWLDVEGGGLL